MELLLGLLLLSLLAAAAGLLFWLTRQSRRVDSPRRRASSTAQLDELAGFGQAILSARFQLDALCEVVFEQVSAIIDTSNFQLGLFDNSDYIIMIWLRHGKRLSSQRFRHSAEEGLIGWVRRTGRELRVGDFEAEWEALPARPSYASSQPARSALFVPLLAGGDPIGVIAVQSDIPHAYNADDLRLLTVLANQAAGAIRNAQLFEQTQARNRQLQLVSEVSQQITTIQPLSNLFEQIVTLIGHTFGFYAVNIFALNEKHGTLTLEASTHPGFREHLPQLSLGEGLVGWAAKNGRTALVSDVTQDTRYLDDGLLEDTHAEVTVPLVVERRVVGVLDVQSDVAGAFSHDDVVVLETMAGQIALAIQEAETYAAERRQRERLHALTEASRAVVSILNVDDLLEEVIDVLTDYFGYDRTHIFLREGDRLVFRAGSGTHSGRWAIEQLSYALEDRGLITRSVRTGQTINCGDVSTYEDYIPGPGVEDTQSEMVIPIRMGLQTLGALDIQSKELNAFSSDDAALGEALCDTLAVALRNATLYAQEKRRRILAESLREVSMVLGASLEVDTVLNGILQGLERVVSVDSAMIVLLDEDAASYRISAAHGFDPADNPLGRLIPLEADILAEMAALFHSTGADALNYEHRFVPLILGEDLIGYLALDYRRGRFTADDLDIINAFAMQSAMAIANAQLYMAQREEAWVSTALLQVAEATGRAESLDEVLRTVARITPLLVGVQWCAVLLAEGPGFRIVEIEGAESSFEDMLVGSTVAPQEWPPLARLLQTEEPVILHDEPVWTPPKIESRTPPVIRQGVMLPLFTKGEVVGALIIGQQDRDTLLSPRKIEMVGGIANQAALAIESAQLYAAQQEEAWVTTALLQVAEAMNAQVELQATLQTVVRLTALLVGVNTCIILLWDETRGCFSNTVSYGLSPPVEKKLGAAAICPDEDPYLVALSRAGMPLTAGGSSPFEIPPVLAHIFDTAEIAGLPLTAHGKLFGLMLISQEGIQGALDQRRMNMLTGIASQTALAIETNLLQAEAADRERLERELEVAKSIQNSFLPDSAPSLAGWDVGTYYRAAHMVGGDFYDFLPLPDGKWGLVVADVADKGMPAALYMALSRTLLRAVARNRNDPAATLLQVNKLLLEDTRSDLFVTVWYAIWNPVDGSLFYACAGHNPPFLIQHNPPAFRTLRVKGIALGVLSEITLETDRVILNPGDTLVLYTDGITEAQNQNGQQFGLHNLELATRAHCQEPASRIIDAIIDALDQHTGNIPQFDDLTLVVVRRN